VVTLAYAEGPAEPERYLVLATIRTKTLRTELDAALAHGYNIVAGDPANDILILERKPVGHRYRVDDRLPFTLKEKSYLGFHALPWSFSTSQYELGVVWESLADGEPQPEYMVSHTVFTRNLNKDVGKAAQEGFKAVAISGIETQAALMEKLPGEKAGRPRDYRLVAAKAKDTIEKEVRVAAAEGFRVVAASGAGHEMLVLMELDYDARPRDYRLISTVRTSAFQKELNAAAKDGYRVVPQTGSALQKGSIFLGGTYSYEQAIIMEKQVGATPLSYLVLGAKREGTIQKELNGSPKECGIATIFLTYQETLTVLQCPPK
jgi:hypothetical protein